MRLNLRPPTPRVPLPDAEVVSDALVPALADSPASWAVTRVRTPPAKSTPHEGRLPFLRPFQSSRGWYGQRHAGLPEIYLRVYLESVRTPRYLPRCFIRCAGGGDSFLISSAGPSKRLSAVHPKFFN